MYVYVCLCVIVWLCVCACWWYRAEGAVPPQAALAVQAADLRLGARLGHPLEERPGSKIVVISGTIQPFLAPYAFAQTSLSDRQKLSFRLSKWSILFFFFNDFILMTVRIYSD